MTPPRHNFLPVLVKIKTAYILWFEYYKILDKVHKYTLGQKIDALWIEIIEAVSIATFLDKSEKQPWVRLAIRKLDTIKVLLLILWETKSLENKKYIHLSEKVDEIGKMLGGWNGQISKTITQNT